MRNIAELAVVPAASLPRRLSPAAAATGVAAIAAPLAARRDSDGSAPAAEIAALAAAGLLLAPLPAVFGGSGLGMTAAMTPALCDVLRIIGGASLPLGRLYEGHVNAVRLATRYGRDVSNNLPLRRLAIEAAAGRLSAVWNAQTGEGLRLVGNRLIGGKIHTSGVGLVHRPVLTAATTDGIVMVMPDVSAVGGDLSGWTPLGMRASLTGAADFTGVAVADCDFIGGPDDYYRAPLFAGGAWRVLAVQLGALERLVALYRAALGQRGRSDDPVQRARFGEAVARLETARLWVARTAACAEDERIAPEEIDALVNMARHEFERTALAIIERIERGIGLSAMLRPNPVERIIRDLTTYLRQPFPDAALDAAAVWALAERPDHCDIGAA